MTEPKTREEQYLDAIANGKAVDLKPITREEMFLAKAGGQDIKVPTPITRKEIFLSKISGGGSSPSEPSGENKLAKLVDGSITELTAKDLEGVTKIKNYAFNDCLQLSGSVIIPNTVTSIGDSAFRRTEISSVTIPDSVTSIDRYAFSYTKIKDIAIPSSVTSLGNGALQGNASLETAMINAGSVGGDMFSDCTELTSVTFSDSVTSIGDYTFNRCSKLTSVTISNSVTSIGTGMFQCCSSLMSVTIPNSVTSIGSIAFRECQGLTNLTIPDSVTSIIGNNALKIGSLSNKATITFLGTTPPTITTSTFTALFLEKIIVPKGCGEAYKTATNWANFADYIEEATE